MNEGYIKLYRSFLKWEWYDTPNLVAVFIHCLLSANYEDKKWHGITIKRGSFVTSTSKMAKALGLSRQQVRTAIEKLELTGECNHQSTNKYTIVTVCNYSTYQKNKNADNQQRPIKQPTDNQRITTTKNDKNDKNDKNKDMCISLFEEFWNAYPVKKSKSVAMSKYIKLMQTNPELHSDILAAIESQKQERIERANLNLFVAEWKHPSTWINQKCWEDEVVDTSALTKKTSKSYGRNASTSGKGRDYGESDL